MKQSQAEYRNCKKRVIPLIMRFFAAMRHQIRLQEITAQRVLQG
jgi:hypothetical protein